MSATAPAPTTPRVEDVDAGTRRRVLELVATDGPVTALQLSRELELTAAGVRRHLTCLEVSGQIVAQTARHDAQPHRGRPARRFVVATRGQKTLPHRYAELAIDVLTFLTDTAGPDALDRFAEDRVAALEPRLAAALAGAGPDGAARVHALARALDDEGYAASARPVPGAAAIQLCLGNCPVHDVAAVYPQLCEAEARAFARLLGVHVQRLSTLATGGHVCTISVPNAPPTTIPDSTVLPTEGQS